MKRTLLLLLVICSQVMNGQDLNKKIYDAYVSGDMDSWLSTMSLIEDRWESTGDYDVLYDLTIAQYGYIAWCMSVKQKKKASSYVEAAELNAEKMITYNDKWARAHALKGAIFGFKVGQEPLKAPILGRISFNENTRAMELDPDDPQVWMERGNIELYKPAIFGGNKRDAVENYLQAIQLYENDPEKVKNNWLYLNTLSGLATAYIKTDQPKKADRVYRKMLEIEPDFKWIRDEVYPEFREKYSGI